MMAKGLSQSELARRIGVTQATIYRAVNGHVQGTKYIHLIARELDSTPAYLTGEIDDSSGAAPSPSALSPAERELLTVFAALSHGGRQTLLRVAAAMVVKKT